MEELCRKDVISVCSAARLGFISDVEVDTETGCVVNVCVSPYHGGWFRPPEPIRIPWSEIAQIGDDTVLVRFTPPATQPTGGARKKFLFR